MTDLEKFIELYKSIGITVEQEVRDDNIVLSISSWALGKEQERLEGYSGFYTDIIFSKEGKFIKQGFWE